jgi:hypothetical protein
MHIETLMTTWEHFFDAVENQIFPVCVKATNPTKKGVVRFLIETSAKKHNKTK